MKSRHIILLALSGLLASCDAPGQATTDADETARTPVGKADGAPAGSCQDACGGPSNDGPCWCDELCISYGDCCLDKAAVCDPPDTEVVDAALLLVNTAGPRFMVDEVGLQLAEAQALLAERAGEDGIDGSGDDIPFESLADLTARTGVDAVALQAITAFAFPLPAWDEYLPASISVTVDALRCQSGYSCSPDEPFTRGISLDLDAEAGTVEAASVRGVAALEVDGSFERIDANSSCTDRFCSYENAQIRGQLSPFGSLHLQGFQKRNRSGNQAYGFTVRQQQIRGPQRFSVYEAE